MPAQRPCAAFEPISPDLDLPALVESTPNFEYVVRIHCDMIDRQGLEKFEKLVLVHVVIGGKPLVVEGYNERLDQWTFSLQWLRDNCSKKVEHARNLTTKTNLPLSIGHYLNNMALLTNQWNALNYKDPDRQRIYLKDIDCPQVWHDKLKDLVPLGLFYLNESTGAPGGLGSVDEPDSNGPGLRKGRGVARAGDLMSSLPPEMRAENMMCYIGHEGTYTPAHREMCASLGQNFMIEASTGLVEDGKPTKPGSSIWFMTESKDRHIVSEYWLSTLGHDIEIENHFAQLNAWKAAPFKTYVVEQRVGDLILIPPLAPHQVWNRGTRTMKAAWNRTTVETLEMALDEALPRARMVCRDEQYKNKAIVYYSLTKYSRLLKVADKAKRHAARYGQQGRDEAKLRQLQKDFRRLFALYNKILLSESFPPEAEEKRVELVPFDSNITCAYCRCNIFNRFLTCPSCVSQLPDGGDDTYDICMECYAMGRSCACLSKLRWIEQFPWADLVQKHESWREQILQFEAQGKDKPPQAFQLERSRLGKRTLAQICQVELKRRPFHDIKKPEPVRDLEQEDVEIEVDDNGKVKRKGGIRRSEKWKKEHTPCHICKWRESNWKLAFCTICEIAYCYGSLVRGFDMMPQAVMEDYNWKCPKCLRICPCRDCIKLPNSKPFEPRGTFLGHNTKKIADPRSVECLVDFGQSNINWLKKAGDDHPLNTRRIDRRRTEAEAAKAQDPVLDENYVKETEISNSDGGAVERSILRLAEIEGIPIDPQLGSGNPLDGTAANADLFGSAAGDLGTVSRTTADDAEPLQLGVPSNGVLRRDLEDEYQFTEAITYEYPDPEGFPPESRTSSQHPSKTGRVPPEGPRPEPVDGPALTTQGKKRKRQSEHLVIDNESNVAYTVKDLSSQRNRPKQQEVAQNGPSPEKASDEESDIERSLIVKLPLPTPQLIGPHQAQGTQSHLANSTQSQRVESNATEAPRISSDLTEMGPNWTDFSPAPSRKIRIERIEDDDDFAPRKRNRRNMSTVKPPHGIPRRSKVLVTQDSEPSDIEEEFAKVGDATPKPQVRRKSKWLEMREEDEEGSFLEDEARLTADAQSGGEAAGRRMIDSGTSDNAAANGTTNPPPRPQTKSELTSNVAPTSTSAAPNAAASTFTSSTDVVAGSSRTAATPPVAPAIVPNVSTSRPPSTAKRPLPAGLGVMSKKRIPQSGPSIAREAEKATSGRSREEENRHAKLKAMQWADGEADSLSDSWSGSEQANGLDTPPPEPSKVTGKAPRASVELTAVARGDVAASSVRGKHMDEEVLSDTSSSSGGEIPSGTRMRRMRPQTTWSAANRPSARGRFPTSTRRRG